MHTVRTRASQSDPSIRKLNILYRTIKTFSLPTQRTRNFHPDRNAFLAYFQREYCLYAARVVRAIISSSYYTRGREYAGYCPEVPKISRGAEARMKYLYRGYNIPRIPDTECDN
jgi:hypothetical protein